MSIEFLLDVFNGNIDREAIIWRDNSFRYDALLDRLEHCHTTIRNVIPKGAVVSLEADYSPMCVAMLLTLIQHESIVVPLTSAVDARKADLLEVAEVAYRITIDNEDRVSLHHNKRTSSHPLIRSLNDHGHSGLVLFSSGSTGQPKASLHDFISLLDKFKHPRHQKRVISFFLFDHIGGINTLFYTLSNGGCLITIPDRSPETVLRIIEDHRAQILPTSPTFINLLLIGGSSLDYDLSSLELVTYGSEVMPETTLERFRQRFPHFRLQQTYGLSEIGILRSKSRSSDSLWVKVGGEGIQTRIVDGELQIRAKTSMLGYLNAPSPFTADGWFKTGDIVEVDGDYIRFLGRDSDIITVGGEKVYPAEVESVIQTMPGVLDVSVVGEKHALMGQIVKARVHLANNESLSEFRRRMREYCTGKLEPYKIPQKLALLEDGTVSERFKRIRQ